MSPVVRRVSYVISYEIVAIVLTALGLVVLGFGGGSSGVMAVTASTVAVLWNYIWNTVFEAWERRQRSPARTLRRRVAHAIGFEGGLVVFLLPIVAWILHVSLPRAFALEAGLLVFFLIYTFVFTWVFDKVWPPIGARPNPAAR
ncbi:PACE efflux transporter [Mycolicibacter algericus]|uniref:Chlorhexidine efflux transporter domain-containing protein n=2 Tax=Mycolicibacter algericus TaxID=1288388 RepID=A0A7I9Y9Q3_MYCAL|nr:PACE efflux transporter [Mycolicibacter algericus]OQZ97680.1 hypothetical protein BST10_08765 [Mycolicibacter algericus DSM 45454]GFG85441.1 hypothetical protein MALGJ_21170 [Mycolicibacter algericus]